MVTTFLPYEDFFESARAVKGDGGTNIGRFPNQPRETYGIILAQVKPGFGYQWHPAVLMWKGHVRWLMKYQYAWCHVVNTDVSRDWWKKSEHAYFKYGGPKLIDTRPPWLGYDRFHRQMRAVLWHKNPEHYFPQFGDFEDDEKIDYFWPRKSAKKVVTDNMTGNVLMTNYNGGPIPGLDAPREESA